MSAGDLSDAQVTFIKQRESVSFQRNTTSTVAIVTNYVITWRRQTAHSDSELLKQSVTSVDVAAWRHRS